MKNDICKQNIENQVRLTWDYLYIVKLQIVKVTTKLKYKLRFKNTEYSNTQEKLSIQQNWFLYDAKTFKRPKNSSFD